MLDMHEVVGSIPTVSTKKILVLKNEDFFIQAAGLAYHHDAVVDIISPSGAVSHHALACISLRLDVRSEATE